GKQLLFMGGELAQWREWDAETSLDWHLLEDRDHQGVQTLVRELNRVYRDTPALWQFDFEPSGFRRLEPDDSATNVLACARFGENGGQPLVCVCNLSPVARYAYRLGLQVGGRWVEALNTDSEYYGGSGVGNLGGVDAESVGWHDQPYSAELT